jgi:hypothetical protein
MQFEATIPLENPVRNQLGILSEDELAEALDVKPKTLQVWRVEGIGPSWVKAGKGVFYRVEDVVRWLGKNVTLSHEG